MPDIRPVPDERRPRIAAGIVSYHPDLAQLRRALAALKGQVEVTWIVDNGSGPDTVRELTTLAADPHLKLVLLGRNLGVAAAQNAALERAVTEGMDFLLLLDQDSVPAPDMVEQLVRAHAQLSAAGQRVAAVGPRWIDPRSGRAGLFYRVRGGRIRSVEPRAADEPVKVDFLISSGTLLALRAAQAVGPMREDLFIDHVDTEWCLRALRAGWRLYGVGSARLEHELGGERRRVWFGRWRDVALHSPDRNYYEVRNTVLLLRTPGIRAAWVVAQLGRLVHVIGFYGLLVAPRGKRLARMARGLWHGLVGRGGPLAPS